MALIIHAPNVHQGGGRTLLTSILKNLEGECTVLADSRLAPMPKLKQGVKILRFNPTLISRLKAEITLKKICNPGDKLLCFGNLPPLFTVTANVYVYIQNRFMSGPRSLTGKKWRVILQTIIERQWLRMRLNKATILVQTETMAHEISNYLHRESLIMPFTPDPLDIVQKYLNAGTNITEPESSSYSNEISSYDFIYVASGEIHKNHHNLLDAWLILGSEGLFPSLCLTLDPEIDANLLAKIYTMAESNQLNIFNQTSLPDEISSLYSMANALVYPSLFESFGLPLLEAKMYGLPVIASERDFVRDVISPDFCFDPESPLSIARAVRRHLNIYQEPLSPPGTSEFLKTFMQL